MGLCGRHGCGSVLGLSWGWRPLRRTLMSMQVNTQTRLPLILVLLAVVAFSISSLPGNRDDDSSETNLSSEFASTCADMTARIENGADSDTCTISPRDESGDF